MGLISSTASFLTNGSTDFDSTWAKTGARNEKVVQKSINKLIEAGASQH